MCKQLYCKWAKLTLIGSVLDTSSLPFQVYYIVLDGHLKRIYILTGRQISTKSHLLHDSLLCFYVYLHVDSCCQDSCQESLYIVYARCILLILEGHGHYGVCTDVWMYFRVTLGHAKDHFSHTLIT